MPLVGDSYPPTSLAIKNNSKPTDQAMNTIPMEDNFEDILGKALRGTGITNGILEFVTGVPESTIAKLKDGKLDEDALRKVAAPLGLDSHTLIERAKGDWTPAPVNLDGIRQFNTPFDDMTVNYYLVWDTDSKQAALFDTGTDASAGLALADELGLKLTHMFLSHSHLDHIMDRDRVEQHSPEIETFVNAFEPNTDDEGPFAGWNHLRRRGAWLTARNRRRRAVCPIDGWRSGLLPRSAGDQPLGDLHLGGRDGRLSGSWPDDHAG